MLSGAVVTSRIGQGLVASELTSLSAGLSFSQIVGLSVSVPLCLLVRCGHGFVACGGPLQYGSLLPQSQQEGESARKTEVTLFYNLTTEVTSLHLCLILLVRSTLGGGEGEDPQ